MPQMIGRNTVIQVMSSGFSGLLTFVILALTARLFGPDILGTVAYIVGVTGLVLAFSDLGLSRAHVHFTAGKLNPSQTLAVFLRLKLALLAICGLVAIAVAWWVKTPLLLIFGLMLIYEFLSRLAESILITFEGLQQAWPQNLIRLFGRIIKLLAVVVVGLTGATALGYSLTFVAEASILFIGSLWLIRHWWPLTGKKSLTRQYFNYALPFFLIIPLSYLQDNGLIVILKQTSSMTQVGFYAAVAGLSGFIKTLYGAVMIFFFPKISALFADHDFKSIQHYSDMAARYLLIIFSPIFMLLFLLRYQVVALVLGTKFIEAVPVFAWLLAYTFLLMLFAPYDHILFATRNHKPLVWVNLTSLVLTLILSFWLTPIFGALGAAMTVILTCLMSGLWHLSLLKRRLKIQPYLDWFKFAGLMVSLVIIAEFFGSSVAVAVGVMVGYFVLMWLFKLVNRNDIGYFFSLIKPK